MGSATERLCLGVITGAHGVRGQVRVKSFTRDPSDLCAYGPLTDAAGRPIGLSLVGSAKGVLIARVEGVADRDAAEALKGVELHVERAALPEPEEDEFYHADLVGMAAVLPDGTAYGVVRAVHDFGAGPVLEIRREDGSETMLAFTRETAPEVDVAAGRLTVDPPAEIEALGDSGGKAEDGS